MDLYTYSQLTNTINQTSSLPIVLIAILGIIFIAIIVMYNTLIRYRNRVKKSKSVIDVYLKQRFDLIPNLVECVKGYSKYEEGTLTEVVELRGKYNENQKLKDGEKLNNKLNNVIAIAESYPDLKANEQYLKLQSSLIKIEDQLQAARRIYNVDVTDYNEKVNVIPYNVIAKMFGFKEESLFEIAAIERKNVNVGENINE